MILTNEGMDKLHKTPVQLEIDGMVAVILISQIQLASRHPRNNGASIEIAKDFALQLQNKIAHIDAGCALALEMGWNPDYDG